MKRSSQEKAKTLPLKTDTTKLKDMQKAYGVSSKNLSPKTTKVTTTSTKSTARSSSTAVTENLAQKSNTSVRTRKSTSPSTKAPDLPPTTRRSHPGESSNTTAASKIIAASKANYAEKYGGSKHPNELKNKTSAAVVNSTTSIGGRRLSKNNNQSSAVAITAGSNNSSPYKTKSPQKTSIKSSTSTSSRLTAQKPPTVMYDSEVASDPVTANDYDDEDFEEDYESDFEEAVSSDGEADEDEPDAPQGDVYEATEDNEILETQVVDEDENDKSSSIREFEKLERIMVEVEEKEKLIVNGKPSALKEDDLGSGEPALLGLVADIVASFAEESEDDDEEEEEEEENHGIQPSLADKRQNAFPTTTGFSINTPTATRKEPFGESGSRNNNTVTTFREDIVGTNSDVKISFQSPVGESKTQKTRRANRGKIIQSMIKLDRIEDAIFHLAPYQYDRFMTVFSGTDRLQTSTQTDQDRSEESAQTEPIEQTAKWTQKPPTWSTTSSSCDIRIVRQEALGVGSDEISEDLSPDDQKIHKQFDFLKNWEQLSSFILRSSRKMLYVLEAEQRIKLPSSENKGSLETIKMNRGLSVLSKLAMHTLACDGEFVGCANGTKYGSQSQDTTTNGNKKHTSKNLVTVWSLKEPSMPLHFLRVWGHVSALKLHMIGRMVVSGNRDGSLNVWNLDESMCYHSQYQEQVIRTPSVNTSCMTPTHILPIVGIEMFSEGKNTFSIISIDKEGLLITWSCHRSHDTLGESTLSQHSSAWSTIHMSVRYQIHLARITKDHLQITCFSSFWDVDATTTGFYFGTFNGYVAKGKVIIEGTNSASTTIEKYQERMDSNPKITSMDISKMLNILVMGCEDGRCRLFELSRKKMVLSLGGKQEPIRVRWSGRRASLLYVALKDSLLIWDLLTSDMNPWKTIHLKDIQDFVLYSPPHKEYLVIVSGNDLIISTPAEEVKPLSNREFARIQSYFSVLC